MLVAYTDGIVEPENAYGEMFGEERLKDLLVKYANVDSSEIIARTMEAVNVVDRRRGIAGRHDDGGGAAAMKVLTAAEMREVDRRTIELGIPGIVLMENAAHRVVEAMAERFAPLAAQRIVVLCGKGNNGGDGLAIARQLHTRFRPAALDVVLLAAPEDLKGDAAANYRMLLACGGTVDARDPGRGADWRRSWSMRCWARASRGRRRAACWKAFARSIAGFPLAKVVAVDIPSGLPSDSARAGGRIRARRLHGDVHRAEDRARDAAELRPHGRFGGGRDRQPAGVVRRCLAVARGARDVPRRCSRRGRRGGHKGTFGHALVSPDRPGKTGAAAMAGIAALRAGRGAGDGRVRRARRCRRSRRMRRS